MNEAKSFYIIKRLMDITVSVICLFILSIPLILMSLVIKMTSKGPVIFWSKRIGKDNNVFRMAKLRTMRNETPELPSNVFTQHQKYYIFSGEFLRKFGIDELPQLFNIIKGDMSIIGPRPALYNYYELIKLREQKGINSIKPGLTGLAQIFGRDSLTTKEKVLLDEFYFKNRSPLLDIKIFISTFVRIFNWDKKMADSKLIFEINDVN